MLTSNERADPYVRSSQNTTLKHWNARIAAGANSASIPTDGPFTHIHLNRGYLPLSEIEVVSRWALF